VNVTFDRDETYVVIASGIVSDDGYDPAQPFELHVYQPARQMANSDTNTDLLVFHGATDAPEVSVWAQGVTNQLFAFEYADFAGYLELPTDDYVLEVRDAAGENTLLTYDAPLETLDLDGAAITVVASGFLTPENNSNGPGFGLWVATADGGDLLELPVLTSVQDLTFDDGQISVFPNPSNSVVNFHSNDNMEELRMLDLSGRVVYSSNVESDQHQVNVRSFESGIYFVQVVTSEGTFTGKLQVQK
ncbi:MAG: T9SS type A sorting domain-containing protein, partial [Bacteroidota bacterium]